MIIAARGTTAVTIDPTLLALIPIVTVLLTIGAGLVGAAIQSRREHERWVRERRYDAFVSFLTLAYSITELTRRLKTAQSQMDALDASRSSLSASLDGNGVDASAVRAQLDRNQSARMKLATDVGAHREEMLTVRAQINEASTPFLLLGPLKAHKIAQEYINSRTVTADRDALNRLETEMRKALRIRD